MKAVKAVYQNGQITFSEPVPNAEPGPTNVLIVFPEEADDPWHSILEDSTPRPALDRYVQACLDEIAQGKSEPLNLEQL
jgi:hypothetical protein